VNRDAEHVQREYGREKWPAVAREIDRLLRDEPAPDLCRVLRLVAREQWRGDDPLECRPAIVGGQVVEVPPSGAWAAEQGILLEALLDACVPGTDLIVELGSGWAWHLLSLWCAGGPPNATYIGAEYTDAGRGASEALAALASHLDFRALPFDYNDPDLGAVPHGEHAVVFTVNSVEQVPRIDPAVFDAIRGLAGRVTCVHCEPVGWQLDASAEGSSRAYAEENDYNRDLVERLREEQAAGRLTIEGIAADVIGTNPRNATTVIRWSAGEGARARKAGRRFQRGPR
jgi:hypothetical protein